MISLSPQKISDEQYKGLWGSLEANLRQAFATNTTAVHQMELYHTVYLICTSSNTLRKTLEHDITSFLDAHCKALGASLSRPSLDDFIAVYRRYDTALAMLERIALYLVKNFVGGSIALFGRQFWRDSVFLPLSAHLGACVVEKIAKLRTTDTDTTSLAAYRDCLLSVGFPASSSREFYDAFEARYEEGFASYVRETVPVDERLCDVLLHVEDREAAYVWSALEESTRLRGRNVLTTTWLEHAEHVGELLLEGLQGRPQLVQTVHAAVERCGDVAFLELMQKRYASWILSVSQRLLAGDEAASPGAWVEALVTLLKTTNASVNLLGNDTAFVQTAQLTLKTILLSAPHANTPQTPVFLAQYINGALLAPEAHRYTPVDALELVVYLQERDVFEDAYLRCLARRLLRHALADHDAEEATVNHLRQVCGVSFATRLSRMFADVAASVDMTAAFQNETGIASFAVTVGTGGTWPFREGDALPFPDLLRRTFVRFEQFYRAHHEARKIVWIHHASSALVAWDGGSATLPGPMALVLAGNAPDDPALRSVAEAMRTAGVLGADGQPTAAFLAGRLQDIAVFERRRDQHVKEDRSAWGDAAVARIMKHAKRMRQDELVHETLRQHAPFCPTEQFVVETIERLVEKEYLERNKKDSSIIEYCY